METERTTVTVNFTTEGWHSWPEAPDKRHYLTHVHRHLFHTAVEVEVFHDDREIEFHDLLEETRVWWPATLTAKLGRMSCEEIARYYVDKITQRYPGRWVRVMISEDGEVGATVIRSPRGD